MAQVREIDIKCCTYYFLDGIIKIKKIHTKTFLYTNWLCKTK